jgi:hypothetical protein
MKIIFRKSRRQAGVVTIFLRKKTKTTLEESRGGTKVP